MAKMSMERAKLILAFAVQWQTLDHARRVDLVSWVRLKLSCGAAAALKSIDQAKNLIGLAAWDQAMAAAGAVPAPSEPMRPQPPKTPLIDRLKVIERQNQELVDLLKWLEGTGRLQNTGGWSLEEIVAAFRGIDLRAVAAERKDIERYAADMQNYWRLKDAADAARGTR